MTCGSIWLNACLHDAQEAHDMPTSTILLQFTGADDLLANCPGLGEDEH